MGEDETEAATKLARLFRACRNGECSRREELAQMQLYRDWPELWQALNDLQRKWPS